MALFSSSLDMLHLLFALSSQLTICSIDAMDLGAEAFGQPPDFRSLARPDCLPRARPLKGGERGPLRQKEKPPWGLVDLSAKHNFILNGLGWGDMPLDAVRKELGRRPPQAARHRRGSARRSGRGDVRPNRRPDRRAGGFIEPLKEIPLSNSFPKPALEKRRSAGRTVELLLTCPQ
jgi:hypothetical protein